MENLLEARTDSTLILGLNQDPRSCEAATPTAELPCCWFISSSYKMNSNKIAAEAS